MKFTHTGVKVSLSASIELHLIKPLRYLQSISIFQISNRRNLREYLLKRLVVI